MSGDIYFPPDECRERAAMRWPSGPEDKAEGWTRLAVVELGGEPWGVFERDFTHWGLIAFVSRGGARVGLRRAVGDPRRIPEPPATDPGLPASLLASHADAFGDELLRCADGPSFEACLGFLPEVTGYTFLSTETSPDIVAVQPDGAIGTLSGRHGEHELDEVWFDPRDHLPEHEPTAAKRGLLGRGLPAVDYSFVDRATGLAWETIAFAVQLAEDPARLAVFVRLRIGHLDGTTERRTWRLDHRRGVPVEPAAFYRALCGLATHWDDELAPAMAIRVPERRLAVACRASLIRAFITCEGDAPRYGTGTYGQGRHATFPPTTLSLVNACIEWNLPGRARRYLDWYLEHAVRDDGTFDYYGPAVSEYGQMLDLMARFARRIGDADWLRERLAKAEAIAGHLLALRRDSQARFPRDDVRHGLLSGAPEADTREQAGFYYAGDCWAIRGLTEIGRALIELGDAAMRERGRELCAESDMHRSDLDISIERSIIHDAEPPFVPPVAGFGRPFETMTQDAFASYTNYRYWIEMLSAGVLRPEWHDAILGYRRAHGGELLGTTRFEGHLDDWPFAGYACALLLRDQIDRFLLGLYGDLALHRMHGTFTAYEQIAVRGQPRAYVADYCVPSQLVVPLMVKWMLVFEEPDADLLWLCKATPRRWLRPGQSLAVERATTRWGLVSFHVRAREDGAIFAGIELPEGFPAEVRLRLRLPGGRRIGSVTVNDEPHATVSAEGEFVTIGPPAPTACFIRAEAAT